MKSDAPAPVKSADRALDILEAVADAAEPPSFSRLMAELGIPRSSLFHLLNTLQSRGYLVQDGATARYRLGQRIGQLAERVGGPPLAAIVLPHLGQLSRAVNETSGFYVRAGDGIEAIASAASSQALAYTMKVGEKAPLYAVSAGKLWLAHMPPDEVAAYLERVSFEEITANTIRSKDRLRDEIAAARRDGFAYSREEFTPGITGIATAVTAGGRIVGALNLAVPTARFSQSQEAVFRRQMASTAAALSKALEARAVPPARED
ncbi:IclR family transcriptional regulator [Phreatobacter aquaticus]|uniref:IclR family transcriptional regulator n=1 Tax=Phreatobacter aquaticus TaxID=2570229 RepID=A0A4D7QR68_9HYPH|nr:IclR family transcriptional regulator [Phreatobacter aquaticus]QCK86582.1 IclR family transcriptional regulator [Phreatobacter aquaticus]